MAGRFGPGATVARLGAWLLICLAAAFPQGIRGASGAVEASGLSLHPDLNTASGTLTDFYDGETVYFVARIPKNSGLAGGSHRLDYRWLDGDREELSFGGDQRLAASPKVFWAVVHPGHFTPGPHTAVLLIDGEEAARETFLVHAGRRPTDQQVRDDIASQGRDWLLAGNTTAFDEAADRYRTTKERTPAGYWKLAWLYHAANTFEGTDGSAPLWGQLDGTCERWQAQRPTSAAAVVMRVKLLLARAWIVRGTDFADSTSGDRMASFRTLVESAREVLDDHADVAARDPEWGALRIAVAMAQGESSARIIERASAALATEPLYYGIHYATEKALEPQWGGSEAWIKRYVKIALERSGAQEGTQAYLRIYFSVAKSARDVLDALNMTGAKQPAMIASFNEVLRAYPDEHNRQIARAMMCFGGDAAQYRALGGRVADMVPPVAWWDTIEWRRGCDAWAFEGKIGNRSTATKTRQLVSFLRGMGPDFWRPVIGAAVLAWLLLEWMLRIVRKPTGSPIPASGMGPYDPSLYPRTYHVRWQQVAISNSAAMRIAMVGAASAWAITTVPWPEGIFVPTAFVACALASLAAICVIGVRLGTRVVLTRDSVEVRVPWRSRSMYRQLISGRSPFLRDGRAVIVYGTGDGGSSLEVPEVERPDDVFWQWFAPLKEYERPAMQPNVTK